MTWHHGYYVGVPYTNSFFRELSPVWIDFCALIKGYPSPRLHEGEAFRYLELGSGMGLGLCLLAAAFPEGQFTGIDFMPEHIAHSQDLARSLGLANIRFLEADLVDLAENSAPLRACGLEPGSCHYVVAHGLFTWVSEAVQDALLAVAAASLLPTGFFYASYNTYPGWLSMTSFQHLVLQEMARNDQALPSLPLQRAATSLSSLLGKNDQRGPLGAVSPFLATDLEQLQGKDAAYLVQEYLNEHWRPLYVAQMHERCLPHKFRYIATANLPDLFEGLLPEPARAVVVAESSASHRETLLDLATNRCFRRDLFSRGSLPLREAPIQARFEALRVRLQEAPPQDTYTFRADYGEVSGSVPLYSAFEQALTDGPLSLGELGDRVERSLQEVVQGVAMLLHVNRIGLDRGDVTEAARVEASRVNAVLLTLMQEGAPYHFLVAPTIGSAVSITTLENLLLEALRQGLEGNLLAACIQMGLQGLNVELREVGGKMVTSEATRRKVILKAAESFKEQRLPFLQALGVVPAASTSTSLT